MTTTLLRTKGGYWRPTAEINELFREGASAGEILDLVPAEIIRKVKKAWGKNPNPEKLVDLQDVARLIQKSTGASQSWLRRKGIKPKTHTGKYKVSWYSRDEVIDHMTRDFVVEEEEKKLTPLFDSHIDFDLPRIVDAKKITQQAQNNPTPTNVWKMIYVLARLFSSQVQIESWQDREDLRDEMVLTLVSLYRKHDSKKGSLWSYLFSVKEQLRHQCRDECRYRNQLRNYWKEKKTNEQSYTPAMD